MNESQILDMFCNRGLLPPEQVDELLNEVTEVGSPLPNVLINYGLIDQEDQMWATIADEMATEFVDLGNYDPNPELLNLIPGGMARLHRALPVKMSPEGVYVTLADPFNPQTIEDLRFALGQSIIMVVGNGEKVEELVEKHYGADSENMQDMFDGMGIQAGIGEENFDADSAEADANSAPIIRYVDLVLYQAIREKASDIHFEPFDKEFKIRYRVDGALYEMAPPPPHLRDSIISRIKVMSSLNIAERRVPQDGRIMKTIDGKPVDMRVSTLPTQHGESVVLRVLDRSSVNLELEDLGLPSYLTKYIDRVIRKPNGIFIVTGPTGAGKTTTLYAAIRKINTIDKKLLTAEDPVEYDIEGIMQVPVNDGIGVDFARILRAFLRQDPDRIMVGEMRDVETAQIAIQASLTGHLVFSTLHTNDAPGAVTRLIDMGCEPFLVAATLEAILAQRLLRKICSECRAPYQPSESLLSQLGLSVHDIGTKEFYTGEGCETCGNTGYKGRQGLFELLDMNDDIRDLVSQKKPGVVLREKALEQGMIDLREDGLRNIYEGVTTIEEVLKYT